MILNIRKEPVIIKDPIELMQDHVNLIQKIRSSPIPLHIAQECISAGSKSLSATIPIVLQRPPLYTILQCVRAGLLPNTQEAWNAYYRMQLASPLGKDHAYDSSDGKLKCLLPPDDKLASKNKMDGEVALFCHEVLHNLHDFIDPASFYLRNLTSRGITTAMLLFTANLEEQLTITGKIRVENSFKDPTIAKKNLTQLLKSDTTNIAKEDFKRIILSELRIKSQNIDSHERKMSILKSLENLTNEELKITNPTVQKCLQYFPSLKNISVDVLKDEMRFEEDTLKKLYEQKTVAIKELQTRFSKQFPSDHEITINQVDEALKEFYVEYSLDGYINKLQADKNLLNENIKEFQGSQLEEANKQLETLNVRLNGLIKLRDSSCNPTEFNEHTICDKLLLTQRKHYDHGVDDVKSIQNSIQPPIHVAVAEVSHSTVPHQKMPSRRNSVPPRSKPPFG